MRFIDIANKILSEMPDITLSVPSIIQYKGNACYSFFAKYKDKVHAVLWKMDNANLNDLIEEIKQKLFPDPKIPITHNLTLALQTGEIEALKNRFQKLMDEKFYVTDDWGTPDRVYTIKDVIPYPNGVYKIYAGSRYNSNIHEISYDKNTNTFKGV